MIDTKKIRDETKGLPRHHLTRWTVGSLNDLCDEIDMLRGISMSDAAELHRADKVIGETSVERDALAKQVAALRAGLDRLFEEANAISANAVLCDETENLLANAAAVAARFFSEEEVREAVGDIGGFPADGETCDRIVAALKKARGP